MATNELSINQILCASLEELKEYAITKGITLPSSATKPIIQGLLITACSKSDETQILQAKMHILAAEQDALTRKLAAENQARIDEAEALERKLAAEQQAIERKIADELQFSRACREETERRLAMEAESREAEAEAEAYAATERARQRAHESEMERRRERQEQEIEAARLLREVGDQGHGQGHGQANLFKPESVFKMLPKWHEGNIDIFLSIWKGSCY